jgi:hypothetical protein
MRLFVGLGERAHEKNIFIFIPYKPGLSRFIPVRVRISSLWFGWRSGFSARKPDWWGRVGGRALRKFAFWFLENGRWNPYRGWNRAGIKGVCRRIKSRFRGRLTALCCAP